MARKARKPARKSAGKKQPAPAVIGSPLDCIVSREQIAGLLTLTPQRVDQLARAGFVPKVARGQYRLVEAVQGYIRFLKDEERRTSKSAAASRVQDERALEIRQRRLEKEHELIPFSEHTAVLDEIVGIFTSEMAGVAARLTRDIEWRRKIETELDDIGRRAADRLEERSRELRKSGDAGASVADDDAG